MYCENIPVGASRALWLIKEQKQRRAAERAAIAAETAAVNMRGEVDRLKKAQVSVSLLDILCRLSLEDEDRFLSQLSHQSITHVKVSTLYLLTCASSHKYTDSC
eukprot:SAG31_NODE_285_length_18479_cov_9.871980_26_plen_104_part_00